MELVSVWSQKVRYQSLSRARIITPGVLQTVLIYPSRNVIAIRSLTNVRNSGPIEIVGTQKSVDQPRISVFHQTSSGWPLCRACVHRPHSRFPTPSFSYSPFSFGRATAVPVLVKVASTTTDKIHSGVFMAVLILPFWSERRSVLIDSLISKIGRNRINGLIA